MGSNIKVVPNSEDETRVVIDTAAPFRSVKEAVLMFGERALGQHVYANKLNYIKIEATSKKENDEPITEELLDTKLCLEAARQETVVMETYLASLKKELAKTKEEIKQLKDQQSEREATNDSEIECLKFVENLTDVPVEETNHQCIQMRRSISFNGLQSVSRVLGTEDMVLKRQFSVGKQVASDQINKKNKKKKKPFMSFIKNLFFKTKLEQH